MRILFVLCALLAVAVTSLARPKNADDANDKTTTALPLVTTIKNNSLNNTPVESPKEKLASTTAYVIPIVTTVDKLTDHIKSDIIAGKASKDVTLNAAIDTTTVIAPTKTISPNTKPVTITTTTTTTTTDTTTVVPITSTVIRKSTNYPDTTTALPPTSVCPPIPQRHFDGLSFLGGIILTICLIVIGVFLCKYCQTTREDKYRTI